MERKIALCDRPPIQEALTDALSFPEDLKFIRETLGYSKAEIGRKFGYERWFVVWWEKKQHVPKEAFIILAVNKWAKILREQLRQSSS